MEKEKQKNESISIYDNYKLDSKFKNTEEKFYFIFNNRELLLIENQLPFTLSFSLGAVDLQKSSVLKQLLAEADKELYKEKKKKHARK